MAITMVSGLYMIMLRRALLNLVSVLEEIYSGHECELPHTDGGTVVDGVLYEGHVQLVRPW